MSCPVMGTVRRPRQVVSALEHRLYVLARCTVAGILMISFFRSARRDPRHPKAPERQRPFHAAGGNIPEPHDPGGPVSGNGHVVGRLPFRMGCVCTIDFQHSGIFGSLSYDCEKVTECFRENQVELDTYRSSWLRIVVENTEATRAAMAVGRLGT